MVWLGRSASCAPSLFLSLRGGVWVPPFVFHSGIWLHLLSPPLSCIFTFSLSIDSSLCTETSPGLSLLKNYKQAQTCLQPQVLLQVAPSNYAAVKAKSLPCSGAVWEAVCVMPSCYKPALKVREKRLLTQGAKAALGGNGFLTEQGEDWFGTLAWLLFPTGTLGWEE